MGVVQLLPIHFWDTGMSFINKETKSNGNADRPRDQGIGNVGESFGARLEKRATHLDEIRPKYHLLFLFPVVKVPANIIATSMVEQRRDNGEEKVADDDDDDNMPETMVNENEKILSSTTVVNGHDITVDINDENDLHHIHDDPTTTTAAAKSDTMTTTTNSKDSKQQRHMTVAADAPLSERLWEVFTTFWPLGFVAFGGPTAHVAILRDHLVVQRDWLDEDQFLELFAIGQVRLF
jgi:hypothetical protein